jgi:hypothetical protein
MPVIASELPTKSCDSHIVVKDAAPEASRYIYEPLNTSRIEIRLLYLQPGHQEDPIECSLSHASLQYGHIPRYETVSYCWGDRTLRSSIQLDGLATDVPASSAQALRALRLPDAVRVLWIDALCVNQNDVEEQNVQVALMCDVYRNGVGNLVYLGEVDDGPDAQILMKSVVRDLDVVLRNIRSETNGFENMLKLLYDENEAFRLSPIGLGAEIDLDSLLLFYDIRWFRRVWVSQEAAFSRASICYWGTARFALTEILKVAVWLTHKANHLPAQIWWSVGVLAAAEMFDYAAHDVLDPRSMEPAKLLALLVQHQNLGAHDPRDHVYGLLGLYQGFEVRRALPKALEPDYEKDLVEVCTNASKIAIEEEGNLQILLHLFHRDLETPEERVFPSWVPRWHRPWERDIDASRMSYFFRADDGMKLTPVVFHGPKLIVEGVTLDVI